jgi:glycerate 2-kinase
MSNRAAELALEVYRRTLEWARGDNLVRDVLWRDGDVLVADDWAFDLSDFDRVIVAGAGKASVAMAQGAESILGDRITDGLIVTKRGHSEPLDNCRILESGHPVPDQSSLDAGSEMLELASSVTGRDFVLFLMSGGMSALLESPREGVTLEDLTIVNEALLASGAPIDDVNAIRSRLSKIKAGGLGVAFSRATTLVAFLSDVEGDKLSIIGSGPFTYPHPPPDVARIVNAYNLDRALPPRFLELIADNPNKGAWTHWTPHVMAGSTQMMRERAEGIAREMGMKCESLPTMSGEARDFPRVLQKKGLIPKPLKFGSPACAIAVGEPIVHRTGSGKGGRAQEMACAFAELIADEENLAVLVAGSDGTDGPTDAAGALVDGGTVARARAAGFEVEATLRANDSYHFHESAGTLVKTGPTGSNLNDLLVIVRA